MKKGSPDFSKRESLKNGIVMALASIAAISRTENAFADNSIKNASTESLASNCPDIGSLKKLSPISPGQRVNVLSYYPSQGTTAVNSVMRSVVANHKPSVQSQHSGGGEFYYDADDNTSPDDGGMVIVTDDGKRWKRVFSNDEPILGSYFGISDTQDDNGPAITRAINFSSNRKIVLPRGKLVVKTPIIFPLDSGAKIDGFGKKGGTVIDVRMNEGYENFGVFHFPGKSNKSAKSPGFRAVSISNIQLIGNLSKCHGFFLQYQYAMRLEQVTLEGFDGAGLFIDKCQDSVFEQVDVFNCGRTSGDRANLKDGFDESKTLVSPIVIMSSLRDDCNYLRFNDCQWEDNPVSPICDFAGGIENYFVNLHAEYNAHWDVSGTEGCTLFMQRKGTIKVSGGGSDEIKYLLKHVYGEFYIDSHRCSPAKNIKIKTGTNSKFTFKDVTIDTVDAISTSGFKIFKDCIFNSIDWSNLDGDVIFENCRIKKSFFARSGSKKLRIRVISSIIDGDVFIDPKVPNVLIDDCMVAGDVQFGSKNGMWLNNNVVGRFTVLGVESRVIIPSIRRLLLPGPPKNGRFSVGDVIDNSLPQSGSFMGWVCVEAGSPGIWKGFGKIDE
ncbi:hypothetical protein [Serratia marcescens]|uniref:hypothetical protein n=1 Tax=Serratia marcescens TaxID=615 RepID=UPI000745566F|nr:hypothetical protein [Serratia marcescens]MBH3207282.1 hypothetical protein [Serratia marcescens]MDP8619644.1 hypothetical protein [Serratia marcescens]NCI52259.1 hypothetical protein [Serratia marcescens]NDJ05069.1 hypothetical protein [Serratia marcescens]NDJ29015.1 hypothetical protein [Serratia marcescens]